MGHMEMPEDAWKEGFVTRLAALFIMNGLNEAAAIKDAAAHADDRYRVRGPGSPEHDAQTAYARLKA